MKITAKKIIASFERQDVIAYLEENKDFFIEHIDLFEKMTPPRKKGGQITSFSDFQNVKLTKKIIKLEERSKRIMATALQNIESANQINKLTLDLLRSPNKETMMNHFRNVIENDLGLASAQIILKTEESISYTDLCMHVFKEETKVCLRTSHNENACLHGGGKACIRSEALIHLTNTRGESFGILTLGSEDIHRFHEGQGIDLLEFLGGIISYKLEDFMTHKGQK
jgi:uncharacterized protein YigA (DUF484 family)